MNMSATRIRPHLPITQSKNKGPNITNNTMRTGDNSSGPSEKVTGMTRLTRKRMTTRLSLAGFVCTVFPGDARSSRFDSLILVFTIVKRFCCLTVVSFIRCRLARLFIRTVADALPYNRNKFW